jgi:hypothetical protein
MNVIKHRFTISALAASIALALLSTTTAFAAPTSPAQTTGDSGFVATCVSLINPSTGQQTPCAPNSPGHAQATGGGSFAGGEYSTASGQYSTAVGSASTTASGWGSVALGVSDIASGSTSVAIGATSYANTANSIAIGQSATAGDTSTPGAGGEIAIGGQAQATGQGAVALGAGAAATGAQSKTLQASGSLAVGSYPLDSITIDAVAGDAISVVVTAGTIDQVYASAAIWGTASGAAIASYDTTVLTRLSLAPVAYWKLNDPVGSTTAADSSGNGYTLSVNGTVTFGKPSVVPSDSETSAQSDGSTGYLGAATFPALVPTGAAPRTMIACANIPTGTTKGDISAWGALSAQEWFVFQYCSGSGKIGFLTYYGDCGTNALPLGPQLLGYSYDGANWTTGYIAGVPVAGFSPGALSTAASGLSLLGFPNDAFSYFPIGRVAIFAGVLTPKDWALLMQAFTGVG